MAKTEVNTMGYKDAFVVAYRDGVRIPLYEARGETDAGIDLQAIAKAKEEIQKGEQNSANIQELAGSIDSRKTELVEYENPDVRLTVAENSSYENESAINAEQDWSQQTGSYYTVQVGVFSKRISASEIGIEGKLMVEELDNGYFRYSSGKYGNIGEAR